MSSSEDSVLSEGAAKLLRVDEESPSRSDAADDSPDLRSELTSLLNRFSRENVSNTPDWILRDYMWDCLRAFERATNQRDAWYGHKPWANQS